MNGSLRRVALIGFSLECNAFAPVTTEGDFRGRCYLEGEALLDEARSAHPSTAAEMSGFVAAMDDAGPWTPVPILMAAAEPGGPIEQRFFECALDDIVVGLKAALPLDGVYLANHGGMTATEDFDPDGRLYAAIRAVVGANVPVLATVDLHANISQRMVESVSVLISYLTNPHVDMDARGREAAALLHEMWDGMEPRSAFIRLPLTPASVTLLTAEGPYADVIAVGQQAAGGPIANVSVVGGFVFSDTPKNGIAVIVTARNDPAPAQALCAKLARQAWDDRHRFQRQLTPLEDAVAAAVARGRDPALPAQIYSDAGDNPGGGGRGNTTELLAALHTAEAEGVLLGAFCDVDVAAAAHRQGVGGQFDAVFNAATETEFAKRFAAPAEVVALSDGVCVGRRGIFAGRTLQLGPSAVLRLGGATVVVISHRRQCADPRMFEMFGLDLATARTVVVKSRGHFRAGFDEFFPPDRVVEVDTAGLTSPVLERIPFRYLPRPVFPLDPDTVWTPPDWA